MGDNTVGALQQSVINNYERIALYPKISEIGTMIVFQQTIHKPNSVIKVRLLEIIHDDLLRLLLISILSNSIFRRTSSLLETRFQSHQGTPIDLWNTSKSVAV